MNPMRHAISSAKRFGGKPEEYLNIHELIDSPKATMNNNTSRALTHNTWFIFNIIPKIFGYNIKNSDGKNVDTIDIAMLHVIEDYKHFCPTPQDFLKHMNIQAWMNNGVKPLDNEEGYKIANEFKEKLRKEREE